MSDLSNPAAGVPTHADNKPTSARRIVIGDDNQDAGESLKMLLELEGHEVQLAYDGAAALQLACDIQPDFIFLDIGMPKLSGYEVARQVREQAWGRSTVLVAITGWSQAEDRRRALEAGFNHHLSKPVDFDKILGLLTAQ